MAQNTKKKNYRVRYDRIIFVILILAVLILILSSCISSCGKKKEHGAVSPGSSVDDQLETLPGGQPVTATEAKPPAGGYQTISKASDDIHSGDLILVNADNPCDFDTIAIEDGTSADINLVTIKSILDTKSERHYSAADWEVGLDRTAAYAMDAWFEGFYQATGNTDIRMIKGYTADSGDYDFRAGRTLTMGIYPDSGSSNFYKPEGDYAWLDEHAAEYGFVVRYPEDKIELFDDTITSRTSATYRYVGIAAATYMRSNSLCLEEFLKEMKNYSIDSMLRVTSGDAQYGLYYIPANTSSAETSFGVPSGDTPYTISGNNVDGFIITVALNNAANTAPTSATPHYEDLDE